MEGTFVLFNQTVLSIVVGQRGGDSVEVRGGQTTSQTAAELGLSVEDNAGTGGGGGSFVYNTTTLFIVVYSYSYSYGYSYLTKTVSIRYRLR